MSRASKSDFNQEIPVNRIFLLLSNPRHAPFQEEAEAIKYLCDKEGVYNLARDIAVNGLNPLERLALVPVRNGARNVANAYNVVEGNRRICALKLMNDPELAPSSLRRRFEKLSSEWTPVTTVPAVVFEDDASVKLWLDRIHSGPQDGVGRKPWSSEQKQRFSANSKNTIAQSLLDYAVEKEMISVSERKGKLTTVQRFLDVEEFRKTLGVERLDKFATTLPVGDFNSLVTQFMRDVVAGRSVTSRKNKPEIVQYAQSLGSNPGVAEAPTTPASLQLEGPGKANRGRPAAHRPKELKLVVSNSAVSSALNKLKNRKLKSLYHSICTLKLESHCPLVVIGMWAFIETLTACAGRKEGNNFEAFLSKEKLGSYGFDKTQQKSIRTALQHVATYGNITKHDTVSALFNGEQANNDMEVLAPVLVSVIKEACDPK